MASPQNEASHSKSHATDWRITSGSMRKEIVARLAESEDLAGQPMRKLRLLAAHMLVGHFEKRIVIHDEESANGFIYVLLSGIGRLTCLNRAHRRILLDVLGPGNFMCIPPLLLDVRRGVRFESVTECEVGRIVPKLMIQDITGLKIDGFGLVLRLTCGRWWELLVRHSTYVEQTLNERVVLSLLELAPKIGRKGSHQNKHSIIDITHQDLAHLVHGSRARVSRCLGRLAARKAIAQQGPTQLVIFPDRLGAMLV